MKSGLYKAEFGTPAGRGTGAIFISDGRAHGGDSMMAYVGSYQEANGQFSANLRVTEHSKVPDMQSVFAGIPQVNINLTGAISGNTITVKGQSPEAPGIPFSATLTWLAD